MKKPEITFNTPTIGLVPRVPNFIQTKDGQAIDIADLTKEDLNLIAKAWREELLHHANFRANNRNPDGTYPEEVQEAIK